jgi:pSer/pThr/pTyr-binding forkhead associated (FHA) protein
MSERDAQPGEYGSGVPIQSYRDDARALTPSDFEERHGSGFLLLTTADLTPPGGPSATAVKVHGVDSAAERTATVSLLAYPIVRTGRSTGHLLTVGRTRNNDVVVPDKSISRFHAFLKPSTEGGFAIQDANSTNGTRVNGSSVPVQGQGSAVDLKSGDNIRLGQVEFTYVDARALRDFATAQG